MTDTGQLPWTTPVAKLENFRDRATRIESPFQDFPRTEGRLHAVLGGAGMGKTSLLNVLPDWLLRKPVHHGQHLVPTRIDYRGEDNDLDSPQTFLLRVVKQLREGLRNLGLCTISERNFEPYFEGRPAAEGFRDALAFLLKQARGASTAEGRSLRDVRLIGLIDDADKVARLPWASDLFRDLRNLYAQEETVRRCLDLVLAGEHCLARYFGSRSLWADAKCLSLYPMTPQTVSNWLEEASEGHLTGSLIQALAAESGGHPFLVNYFVHEIRRRAESRGWDHLPVNIIERMARGFLQQHQDMIYSWLRALSQVDSSSVMQTTCHLLAQAGVAGLDVNTVDDMLWDQLGQDTDAAQTLQRLAWQGIASPVPDTPHSFAITGVFQRYYQQNPTLELPPELLISSAVEGHPSRQSSTIEYADFDLHVSKEGNHYRVRVESRWGEASQEFYNPITTNEQATIWQNVTQWGHKRDVTPFEQQPVSNSRDIETIGGDLFQAIFYGEVLGCLRKAQGNTTEEKSGLRIKLILESPELHSLPWELLYDENSPLEFLALSKKTPLVRYVEQPTLVPGFEQVEQLRLLFAVAAPENYPTLNLEQEIKNIRAALESLQQQGRITYTILQGRDVNSGYLQQTLRDNNYHVFHFLGHGTFDAALGEGALLLEGTDCRGERLPARQLARLLRDEGDIRLVFLNACSTAQSAERSPFTSVAGALVRLGVPAVIASQYAISDQAAISFAQQFYQALAAYHPLETAVAEGRKAIDISEKNYEWGVPVLYLRAQDGRIF